jgi:uncharacterized protein YkwD
VLFELRYFVLVCVALVTSTAACSSDDSVDYKRDCPPGDSAEQCVLFDLINRERASAGLEPYIWDPALAHAAQAHCEDMAENDFFDHEGSDGSSFGERAERSGYDGSPRGENIARAGGPQQVFERWMASDGHRANLMSDGSTDTGIGYCGGDLWVAVFGRS